MAFRLFSRAGVDTSYIVADIDTGSIGLAIVSVPKKGAAHIEAAVRTPLRLDEGTPEQILSATLQSLPETTQNLLTLFQDRKGTSASTPDEGYVIFHAPWVRAFGARVEGNLGAERVIEEDMIRSLSKEALKHMEGLDQSRFFEASVLRVDVNGYPTKKPEGKKASTVAVTALGCDIDTNTRRSVLEALSSVFPGRSWKERSAIRVAASVVSEEWLSKREYVFVDIASDGTDITVMRKNETTEHILAPEGVRTILKKVTPTNGLPEETLSLLSLIASDQCDDDACAPVRDALGKAEVDLAKIFGEAFAAVSKNRRLPNALVLSVHPALAPWFEHFFSRVDFGQFTATTEPFSVETLSPAHLSHTVSSVNEKEVDTALLLAAAALRGEKQST